jgi:hypothetical protein
MLLLALLGLVQPNGSLDPVLDGNRRLRQVAELDEVGEREESGVDALGAEC